MKFTDLKKQVGSSADVIPVTMEVDGKKFDFVVKKSIPSSKKYQMIAEILALSSVRGHIDHYLVEMLFNLQLVYNYTDIAFTETQKNKIFESFDILEASGVIDLTILNMQPEEYKFLFDVLVRNVESLEKKLNSSNVIVEMLERLVEKFNIPEDLFDGLSNIDIGGIISTLGEQKE